MNQSLVISYQQPSSAEEQTDEPWVRLEQITPGTMDDYASLADLHELWMAAASGQSAQLVRASTCPVEFDGDKLHVYLGLYAWVSSPDLQFSLSPAIGELSEMAKVTKSREFSALLDNSDAIDLDFYLEDATATWETPCFDSDGAEITPPTLTITNGTQLRTSTTVFGVARITGSAVGYHTTAKMTLEKPLEEVTEETETSTDDDIIWLGEVPGSDLTSWQIENLENTITASWQTLAGETDTDQLRLELPSCVEELLAMCPDMYQTISVLCSIIYTKEVYWNPCSGNVVFVRNAENPQKFCTQISSQTVIANPWGIGTL